jgi:hypothetical protein
MVPVQFRVAISAADPPDNALRTPSLMLLDTSGAAAIFAEKC